MPKAYIHRGEMRFNHVHLTLTTSIRRWPSFPKRPYTGSGVYCKESVCPILFSDSADLSKDYRDAQRTYNDIAQTLALYPALVPRTDTYSKLPAGHTHAGSQCTDTTPLAYENGVSALLLHLKGTLPVNFRGSQYQFPIAIWVPQAYPYASPIL